MASSIPPLSLNTWEICALKYEFPDHNPESDNAAASPWRHLQDPIIYPGIYSASGFDVISILVRTIPQLVSSKANKKRHQLQVRSRPNPQIELGAIDCSVALVLCDLELPDSPIVYVSDSFCELTGFSRKEVLGKNCRFLQKPPKGKTCESKPTKISDKAVARRIGQAIRSGEEIQVEVVNYKRNGKPFTNFLSVIPLDMDTAGHRYAVGLLFELN